ncbi:hypothetical protein PRIPAC_80889 [Pristionchus pacificus]|uniref:Uncharacterized protein n=1 Tax=Pristionchus pacificus TaxID=54126 RepID=A0A2A6BVH7_PRIPA|nr:hypothetical protein PRIPAC_80889 [Pristionchus pacificus]|eukprot:PDM69914.1 hypothetical protein PRIPAC_49126 [Pristionchus pacificus]
MCVSMSRNMPIASRAPKRGHNDEVNEGKGACFDLLGLSNKTINKVLSYLPVKDRMRARLNKRLSKIEAESKCYLKKVELKQIVISFSEHSTCVNIKNRWYPFDFLKRIARNTSIGRLEIDFYPDGLIHKFCNLTKEFRSISTIYVKLNLQFLMSMKEDNRNHSIFMKFGICNKHNQKNVVSIFGNHSARNEKNQIPNHGLHSSSYLMGPTENGDRSDRLGGRTCETERRIEPTKSGKWTMKDGHGDLLSGSLTCKRGETANLVKTDSFFVDLTKLCEILKLDYSSSITSAALHQRSVIGIFSGFPIRRTNEFPGPVCERVRGKRRPLEIQ